MMDVTGPTPHLKISAVVATHNRPVEILLRALDSISAQTAKPYEVIVADSGTSEELSEQIRKIVENRCWHYERVRKGADGGKTRNTGAKASSGDFLAFLDDDDEWHPDKIKNMLPYLKEDVGLIFSDYDIENGDGTLRHCIVPEEIDDKLLGRNLIGCTSMPLVSKEAFDTVGGFDEKFKANQEWDLWVRVCATSNAVRAPGSAGIKHHSECSVTTNSSRRAKGWNRMFAVHLGEYLRNPVSLKRASGSCIAELFMTQPFRMMLPLTLRTISGILIWSNTHHRRS